ncbi:TPA: phosphorylcholine transferase LicD [Streptococcus suis]
MSDTIKIIQRIELDLLREFIRVCELNNLRYFILGGTLLGAVRHNGFIPWDDDIDVGMPREDFEKLKSLSQDVFQNPYYCIHDENDSNYTKAFMKLQDQRTSIIMTYSNERKPERIWIDIFPIDGMPARKISRKIHEFRYLYSRMMVQLSQFDRIVNQSKKNRPAIENIIIRIAKIINFQKLLSYEKRHKAYNNILAKYNISEEYAGNLSGAYKLKEVVPSNYFGKGVKLNFAGIDVNAPEKYKDYLTAIYGKNFMQLPPVDDRLPHQYEIVSLGEYDMTKLGDK